MSCGMNYEVITNTSKCLCHNLTDHSIVYLCCSRWRSWLLSPRGLNSFYSPPSSLTVPLSPGNSLTKVCLWPKRLSDTVKPTLAMRSAGVQLQQPGIQPEKMNGVSKKNESASQFSFGLPVYFKCKILFYTFTKTLGQRFDIFSFLLPDLLSPQIIVALPSSCFSDSLGISLIILSTSSNVSCS